VYVDTMLLLEYLGYVALYGYIILGTLYFISTIFRGTYSTSIDTIPDYAPYIGPQLISNLDSLFQECGIEQID
jgi:hypothetical protein